MPRLELQRMDRLQQLIFLLSRRSPDRGVGAVARCQMRRSWGSIRIECVDVEHLEQVSSLLVHLRLPLSALGLGRQIVLRVPGSLQRTYPCCPVPQRSIA